MKSNFAKQVVAESIAWIEKQLCEPISVPIVAERCGYSLWHFQKMFKDETGISAGQYIRMRRLSRSMKELRFTDKPILEIAIKYQFGSNATFTRSFKKALGMTPAMYRVSDKFFIEHYQPALNLNYPVEITSPEIIYRKETYVTGINDYYISEFGVDAKEYEQFTYKCWVKHLSWTGKKPDCSLTFLDTDHYQRKLVIRKYLGTLSNHPISENSKIIPAGPCARFYFSGSGSRYFNFVLQAHSYVVNTMKLNKRGTEVIVKILDVQLEGNDIEKSFIDIIIDIPFDYVK